MGFILISVITTCAKSHTWAVCCQSLKRLTVTFLHSFSSLVLTDEYVLLHHTSVIGTLLFLSLSKMTQKSKVSKVFYSLFLFVVYMHLNSSFSIWFLWDTSWTYFLIHSGSLYWTLHYIWHMCTQSIKKWTKYSQK